MASEGNGQPSAYQVHMSGQTLKVLKQLHQEALQNGIGKAFLEAVRQIYKQRETRPVDFGEPLYRLPALNVIVYQAAIKPLVVSFAVHQETPLVFIKDFKLIQ
jgi:hypothetical protein